MDISLDWLWRLGEALLQLLLNPLYYVGLLLILLQYRRQMALERKLFHVRLHSMAGETLRAVLSGWLAGLAASLVMAVIGARLQPETVLLLWGLTALFMLVRARLVCLAYAVGALGLLQTLYDMIPSLGGIEGAGWLTTAIVEADMPSLLALVAVLHLMEGLLVRWQGQRLSSPLFFEGKRGRLIGGYHLHGFWPVPLFLLIPSPEGLTLPWTPFFYGDAAAAGWTIMAMPALIGFTERTVAFLPHHKTERTSGRLYVYGVILLALAIASQYVPLLVPVAALLGIVLHEALLWVSRREESNRRPLFVHERNGLKILAVLPDSPAAAMGLEPGETIYKVNGEKVQTKEQLHQAMRLSSAFCRLEVVNGAGQNKFVSRALYAGDHHQLGLILCPDADARYFVSEKQRELTVAAFFLSRWKGLRKNDQSETL
ncbi:PDZ domain-containing protein [Paenibacillus sp. MBLB4367]|uniref:PDZ domain-containing protein n=1 Tax=Paenibacillus sp. MBLB4367 TaxID=3384767 RepID=UPI0039082B1B